MEWWEKVIQNSILSAVAFYGIKEGFPIIRLLLQELLTKSQGDFQLQNEMLHKLDALIEQEIINLSEISNNHSELYRLLSERGFKNDEILTILNKIEMSLQQISLDLHLQQDFFRKNHSIAPESE
jgi:hypothetical protein